VPVEHAPEYIEARRALLSALEALGTQRKAVVLVGAQAIYLHVGPGYLQVAPYTTDGDLALNPALLDDEPLLAQALLEAGFSLALTSSPRLKPGDSLGFRVGTQFVGSPLAYPSLRVLSG
jgi:hypothetical protein